MFRLILVQFISLERFSFTFFWGGFVNLNSSKNIQGGKILVGGGSAIESEGNFVQPTIIEISPDAPVVKEELFGPVLYVMKFQVLSSLLVGYSPP